MERLILKRLLEWKNSPYRKPLILEGVRQVGKTWVLKEFGKRYYQNTAYFNFDENEEYKQFFETTKDIDRILQNLMLASGQKILPEETLIIFDEVQDCPKVINSMKYFCENAPQYHIACAGSLLGIALSKPSSFPVGKVDFMQINPMTFTEFLLANGDEILAKILDTVNTIEPLPNAFFNPLCEKLKMYYVTGGMPEPVLMWTEARDVDAMQEALSNIIGAYERDFGKHPNISEFPKISMIWKSIPSQLARENKKFIYKVVKEGARAREYEDALQWLVDARLVHKIFRSTAPGLPMSAYDDLSAFKIYLVDVGLLRRLAQLAPSAFGEGNRLFTEFKGALTENYVLQTLVTQFEVVPRYWSQNNPPYEVDFLIQRENDIFPIEVKSESNTNSRSLKKYKELFSDKVKLRVRFSLDNLKLDDDVLNIPLFMADQADRLIGLALEQQIKKKEPSEFDQRYETLRCKVAEALTMYACCYHNPVDLAQTPDHMLPQAYISASDELRKLGSTASALAATIPENEKNPPISAVDLETVSSSLIGLSNSMSTPYNRGTTFQERDFVTKREETIRKILHI